MHTTEPPTETHTTHRDVNAVGAHASIRVWTAGDVAAGHELPNASGQHTYSSVRNHPVLAHSPPVGAGAGKRQAGILYIAPQHVQSGLAAALSCGGSGDHLDPRPPPNTVRCRPALTKLGSVGDRIHRVLNHQVAGQHAAGGDGGHEAGQLRH